MANTRWTSRQDGLLTTARARVQMETFPEIQDDTVFSKFVSAKEIARKYQELGGEFITEDQARNRLRRLDEQTDIVENEAAAIVGSDDFIDIEVPKEEFVGIRMGFWDLETTDLNAMMGRILVSSISDSWGNVTTRTIYDFPQESVIDDRGVAEWTRDELNKYDIIVTWNGKMFDQPFLNARLLRWGKAPWLGQIHQDPMWTARAGSYGLRIGSSKLVNVSKYFDRGTSVEKTDISWDLWALAQSGDEDAMKYLVEHCEQDTLVLRSVWNHLKPMFRGFHR